jgi:hypothetical protein
MLRHGGMLGFTSDLNAYYKSNRANCPRWQEPASMSSSAHRVRRPSMNLLFQLLAQGAGAELQAFKYALHFLQFHCVHQQLLDQTLHGVLIIGPPLPQPPYYQQGGRVGICIYTGGPCPTSFKASKRQTAIIVPKLILNQTYKVITGIGAPRV